MRTTDGSGGARARWTLACVVALVAGGCAAETAVVAPGAIEERIVARAVVEPIDGTAEVRADRIGRIVDVRVREGDSVAAGDELARIDASSLIEPASIRAPVAGVVMARHVDPGDDVDRASGPLFEIADPTRVRVRFELEDADSDRVDVGMHLAVTARGSRVPLTEASVDRLASRMEPRQIGASGGVAQERRLVRAGWAELPPSDAFPLGRELEVRIALPSRPVDARVPRGAVAVVDGRPTLRSAGVWGSDIEVRLGAADDRHVEVRGVEAGTVVARRR